MGFQENRRFSAENWPKSPKIGSYHNNDPWQVQWSHFWPQELKILFQIPFMYPFFLENIKTLF
jgi:hypothetical protein